MLFIIKRQTLTLVMDIGSWLLAEAEQLLHWEKQTGMEGVRLVGDVHLILRLLPVMKFILLRMRLHLMWQIPRLQRSAMSVSPM